MNSPTIAKETGILILAHKLPHISFREHDMFDRKLLKEIISILMGSVFYLNLTVRERLDIVKHLMRLWS